MTRGVRSRSSWWPRRSPPSDCCGSHYPEAAVSSVGVVVGVIVGVIVGVEPVSAMGQVCLNRGGSARSDLAPDQTFSSLARTCLCQGVPANQSRSSSDVNSLGEIPTSVSSATSG